MYCCSQFNSPFLVLEANIIYIDTQSFEDLFRIPLWKPPYLFHPRYTTLLFYFCLVRQWESEKCVCCIQHVNLHPYEWFKKKQNETCVHIHIIISKTVFTFWLPRSSGFIYSCNYQYVKNFFVCTAHHYAGTDALLLVFYHALHLHLAQGPKTSDSVLWCLHNKNSCNSVNDSEAIDCPKQLFPSYNCSGTNNK